MRARLSRRARWRAPLIRWSASCSTRWRKPAGQRRRASSAIACGCRHWRRRWSMVRRVMRSIMTMSTWRCQAIPRSRSCRGCWRSPKQKRSSGRDVITAFVAGYETACRIGMALQPRPLRRSVFTRPQRSAALARPRRARACSASMPRQRRWRSASPEPRRPGLNRNSARCASRSMPARPRRMGCWRRGLPRAGFRAAPIFSNACRASPRPTVPDFSPAAALAEPENGFHMFANLFKYHAACYLTHAPIECAREVRREHAPSPDNIAAITLALDASIDRVCNIPAPVDGLQSKFSLRQTVAMALAGVDTASLGAYSEANARDPALIRLRENGRARFSRGMAVDRQRDRGRPRRWQAVSARHDAGIPATDIAEQGERLAAKFDALVAPVLGAPRTRELRQTGVRARRPGRDWQPRAARRRLTWRPRRIDQSVRRRREAAVSPLSRWR